MLSVCHTGLEENKTVCERRFGDTCVDLREAEIKGERGERRKSQDRERQKERWRRGTERRKRWKETERERWTKMHRDRKYREIGKETEKRV